MARRYIRDKNGRFASGGGTSGGVAQGKARRKGGEALKATAGAAMAKAERKGVTARRNIRAGSEAANLGVMNKATGRYRKASPKVQAVAAARAQKGQAIQQAISKEFKKDLQAAQRRGRNVEGLALKRRYARPR